MLLKLDQGPTVTALLSDPGEMAVEIGMPIEMVTRRIKEDSGKHGMLVYGYKFRPTMG